MSINFVDNRNSFWHATQWPFRHIPSAPEATMPRPVRPAHSLRSSEREPAQDPTKDSRQDSRLQSPHNTAQTTPAASIPTISNETCQPTTTPSQDRAATYLTLVEEIEIAFILGASTTLRTARERTQYLDTLLSTEWPYNLTELPALLALLYSRNPCLIPQDRLRARSREASEKAVESYATDEKVGRNFRCLGRVAFDIQRRQRRVFGEWCWPVEGEGKSEAPVVVGPKGERVVLEIGPPRGTTWKEIAVAQQRVKGPRSTESRILLSDSPAPEPDAQEVVEAEPWWMNIVDERKFNYEAVTAILSRFEEDRGRKPLSVKAVERAYKNIGWSGGQFSWDCEARAMLIAEVRRQERSLWMPGRGSVWEEEID